ncbi:hypothetical protein CRH09_39155 [Nocardia terpenica]|uniref:Uncharacterized protein n=2 Tax=Nocardia terpenica TaxID=455432 RepID=A0A164ILC7_9NOCA|nr:hypothetical protein CRH09_39155 [Nocardia terpenica]KZM69551.1 hypothetical protein AWN90_08600 [Nocardia terpenica]
MEAYVHGRMAGSTRSFTLPDDRAALDEWVARCRESAADRAEFDTRHRIVDSYLASAPEANAAGTFPSITWTEGTPSITVSYQLLPAT